MAIGVITYGADGLVLSDRRPHSLKEGRWFSLGRGAPNRKDLDYFPKMVNFYEDDKIFDLLDEYGPLGVTIYDCILTIIYSNGYFANLSKDKLSKMVIRKIGNKWIKSQKVVVQVIDYCADLGLFDKDLMLQNIITSVGIQKRYYKIAVKLMKRQLYSKEFWLLDENGEPLLKSPIFPIFSEENGINSEENNHSSEESPLKRKETKIKQNKKDRESGIPSEENREQALLRFEDHRKRLGKPLSDDGRRLLLKELEDMAECDGDRTAILNQSIMNGWSGIFPLRDKGLKPEEKRAKNQFHNFTPRDTDYDALVQQDVNEWLKGGTGTNGREQG